MQPLTFQQKFPEPNFLLIVIENSIRAHASLDASVVAAFLAAPTRLDCDGAIAALLANKVWVPGLLVRPSPECPTTVTDNAAIISQMLLSGLGLLLTHEADLQVPFVPRIVEAHGVTYHSTVGNSPRSESLHFTGFLRHKFESLILFT